jgi:hypothetical protein
LRASFWSPCNCESIHRNWLWHVLGSVTIYCRIKFVAQKTMGSWGLSPRSPYRATFKKWY